MFAFPESFLEKASAEGKFSPPNSEILAGLSRGKLLESFPLCLNGPCGFYLGLVTLKKHGVM